MKFRFGLLSLFLFVCAFGRAQSSSVVGDSLLNSGKFKEAIAEYDRVLVKEPNNIMVTRYRAGCYFHLQNYVKAEKGYRKVLKSDPKCTPCYSRLIDIRNYLGNAEQAIALADSCIELYKGNASQGNFKLQKAYLLFYQMDLVSAELLFDEVVNEYPDSANVYFYRADFNFQNNSKSQALRDVIKAIELDNSKAAYHKLEGKIYTIINYTDKALKSLSKAISLDSNDADTYLIRGSLLAEKLNKPKEGATDLKKAVLLDSTKWQYYVSLGNVYHTLEDMDSACWCADKTLFYLNKVVPSEESEYYKKGMLETKAAFCDESKPDYYYQRGVAMYNLGLYDSAVTYYNWGLKFFPRHTILISFRGNAYLELQKWEEAERDYMRSMQDEADLKRGVDERFPSFSKREKENYIKQFFSSTYSSLSHIYLAQAKYEKALWAIDTAIAIEPLIQKNNLHSYYNQKGRVYMAMGDYDKAFEIFKQVKMLAPKNPLGYMNMALALANKAAGKKNKLAQFSISGTYKSLSNFNYKSQPIKLNDPKRQLLKEAITYCDIAVDLAKEDSQTYLIRGYIKHLLGSSSACEDVRKAMYLGNADAGAYYQSICR